MKNLRNLFILLILSIAFYSCDADATLDEVEQIEFDTNSALDTGDQGNEVVQRDRS